MKILISWNFVHCLFALVCTLQYKQLVHELRLNKGYEQEIYWFRLVLFQKFLETGISSHKHMQTVRQLAVCSFYRILILSRKTPLDNTRIQLDITDSKLTRKCMVDPGQRKLLLVCSDCSWTPYPTWLQLSNFK